MSIFNIFRHEQPETPDETGSSTIEILQLTKIGGFERCRFINNEEVANFLRETLPITHFEKCPFIRYEVGFAPHEKNALGSFYTASHKIRIWGAAFERFKMEEDDIKGTITHEVGHNVHFNLMAKRADLTARWETLHDKSMKEFDQTGFGFVSDYARTNIHEDFAETYAIYVLDPETLQFYSPDKYAFMQQHVFHGREYPAK